GAAMRSGRPGKGLANTRVKPSEGGPRPTPTAEPVSVVEGSSGETAVTLHFHLSAPLGESAAVYVGAFGGTATQGTDYIEQQGHAPLPRYETEVYATVYVKGDTIPEPDETAIIRVTLGIELAQLQGQTTITILNDEYLLTPAMQNIDRGVSSALVLTTSVPASTTERVTLSSDAPSVISVPPYVDIPAGSTQTTIPITGGIAGVATISAGAPPNRGGQQTATVTVMALSSLSFDPPEMAMALGSTGVATLHLIPAPEAEVVLAIYNGKPSVAEVPLTVTIDAAGNGTFLVKRIRTRTPLLSTSL